VKSGLVATPGFIRRSTVFKISDHWQRPLLRPRRERPRRREGLRSVYCVRWDSFDHLIGKRQQHRRQDAECLRRAEVDDQLESRRGNTGKSPGFSPSRTRAA
jgi:hypothetical protein